MTERSITELCCDIAAAGDRMMVAKAEHEAYLKELDIWWAKIEANRKARLEAK